jgi:hypothetical protein
MLVVVDVVLVCAGGIAVLARHWRLSLVGLVAQYVLSGVLVWQVAGAPAGLGLGSAGLTTCAMLGLTLQGLVGHGRMQAMAEGRYFDASLVRRHAFFDDFFLLSVILVSAVGAWGVSLQHIVGGPAELEFAALWLGLAGVFAVLLASDFYHAVVGLLLLCHGATLLQIQDGPVAGVVGLAGAVLQLAVAAAGSSLMARHYLAAGSLSWSQRGLFHSARSGQEPARSARAQLRRARPQGSSREAEHAGEPVRPRGLAAERQEP